MKLSKDLAAKRDELAFAWATHHDRAEFASNMDFNDGFHAGLAEGLKLAEGLVSALGFYADKDNWSECSDQTTSHMVGPDDHVAISPFSKQFKAGLKAELALAEFKAKTQGDAE